MTLGARKIRKLILDLAFYAQDANLQSVFSSVEILHVLYSRIMNISIENRDLPDRDFFVLSKGQATMGLLANLIEKGFIRMEEVYEAGQYHSRLSMQADRTKIPGVEISAGSLGHGFPIAAGIAYGKKIQELGGKVYVLAGDGEMNEGTMWEAALFAGSEQLNNLVLVIDDNDSIDEMLNMGSLYCKLKEFGFDVYEVNGHCEEELYQALAEETENKPRAVIAKTIRGYGSKTIMEQREWFHRAPDAYECRKLKKEVDMFET